MGLRYDFDIVTIAPEELANDHDQTETPVNEAAQVRVLFRDFHTAEALRDTSPGFRRMFLDAGFEFETRKSELPFGAYRRENEDQRNQVIRRLFADIKAKGLEGEYCGDFDMWAFLDYIRTARPQGKVRRKGPLQLLPYIQPEPEIVNLPAPPRRRTVPWRLGVALGFAVLIIAALRLLAAAGASP